MSSKTLIIGLDGASFNILDPFMSSKTMPNLSLLAQRGVRAFLTSTIPSNTPVGWTSLSTGTNPGKHSIFGFYNYHNNEMTPVSSLNNMSHNLWDILADTHKKSLIINVPFTWPPKKILGVMACFDWTPAETTNSKPILAEPESVNQYIYDHNFSRIALTHPYWTSRVRKTYHDIIEMETDFATHMAHLSDWRLMFIVFRVTDMVIHSAPSNPALIAYVYQIVDHAIGRLLQLINLQHDSVFIVSDHGTKVFKMGYPIPAILKQQGFLVYRKGAHAHVSLAYKIRDTSLHLLHKLSNGKMDPLFDTLSHFYYEHVLKKVTSTNEGENSGIQSLLDKTNSFLYLCNENSCLDVLLKINPHLYQKIKHHHLEQQLLTHIMETINQNDTKIIANGWTAKDIYSGPYLKNAPDLILEMNEEIGAILTQYSYYQKAQIVMKEMGGHSRQGILIAAGKDIPSNTCRSTVNILDIAPTVLYTLNVPIPCYVDGNVITDLFSTTRLSTLPPRFSDNNRFKTTIPKDTRNTFTSMREKQFRKQLTELGYL